MNKKLITEQLATNLVSMLDETQMVESDKKEIYNRIMEQQVATLKQSAADIVPTIEWKDVDREMFNLFYERWTYDTLVLSDMNKKYTHPDYIRIINMGKRAVPFIYEILKNRDDGIVYALDYIYKNDKDIACGKFVNGNTLCKLWKNELKKRGF